jgi:threonine/homoserine/homoserine lactone efflux protein
MELALMGLGLGLAAGVSPGPLLALLISSTLERGFGAGLRVAVAPLITDLPIIVLALFFLRQLSPQWLALLALLGGAVVIHLGIATLRAAPGMTDGEARATADSRDLWRGALVNFLNPHPWIFWITVQGPITLAAWSESPAAAIAFVLAFYVAIVGSKVAIAAATARGRRHLSGSWYRRLLVGCGALLVGMGLWLALEAVRRLL